MVRGCSRVTSVGWWSTSARKIPTAILLMGNRIERLMRYLFASKSSLVLAPHQLHVNNDHCCRGKLKEASQ